MNQVFIKTVKGRSVRDPETKQLLAETGEYKPRSGFWLKRLKQGDVVETKPTKTTKEGDK